MIRKEFTRWRIKAVHMPSQHKALVGGLVAGLTAMAVHRKVTK